jgi:hypothetical protein
MPDLLEMVPDMQVLRIEDLLDKWEGRRAPDA